ncbi:hypothetical protein F4780DRAFT_573477 [Xylariomycetidae sp. FL0641]|nr:hypothetical protein F4780DRAFT_573477 [Xylariomycetidae sp. FL0641]
MSLRNPLYVFRALTCFGFATQWIVMILNGAFVAMLTTTWHGAFASGTPIKSFTGIWPLDFVQGLLVVFFGVVNNIAEIPDLGPWLMLADLVFSLVVFGLMTVAEDKRSGKTSSLKSPTFWQFAWNWCGAASVLPVYCHLYLEERSNTTPRLARNQAHALPFTALWCLLISLPLLLPSALDAAPFTIQNGVVLWQFGPLTLSLVQDLFSYGVGKFNISVTKNPVRLAYWIVGAASAAVHLGVLYWAYVSPELSWSRIYVPNHAAVRPGPTLLTEGAMVFMQYDILVILLCVLALGFYAPAYDQAGKPQTPGCILTLTGISLVAGPGAGLAWFLCSRETEADLPSTTKKVR